MVGAEVAQARALLEANGYVVLREKSYRLAQERQRVAEARQLWEKAAAQSARDWAIDCLDEDRRLADRLTFVWGVAMAHGATSEELAADPLTREHRNRISGPARILGVES